MAEQPQPLDLSRFKGHTPDWRVVRRTPAGGVLAAGDYADEGEPDLCIEVCYGTDADLRLAAAAPDLVAELERARELLREARKFIDSTWTIHATCDCESCVLMRRIDAALPPEAGDRP